MLLALSLSPLLGLTSITAAPTPQRYPNPEPCLGNCSWIHDPSIIKEDNRYYRFSTSRNIAIATAPSLSGPWEYKGALLDNGTNIYVDSSQDIWAPSIHKIGDEYYAFYSVSIMGSQDSDIGYARSLSLDPRTWTDHGSLGLSKSAGYNLIDPFVYMEDPDSPDGMFIFGSYWNGIHQFSFKNPPTKFLYAPVEAVITNHTSTAENNDVSAVVEGGTMFKYADFYYLFFSVGKCCNKPPKLAKAGDEYRVAVCRSQDVKGPYVDADGKSCKTENGGTIVLASHDDVYSPGGQGVIMDEESKRVVMYYHYVKPSVGYNETQFFFGFNYLDFSTGWPVLISGYA